MNTNPITFILGAMLSLFLSINANAQQTAKTITDGYHTITYTSLPDAKKKIIEYKLRLKHEAYNESYNVNDYGLYRLHQSSFPMGMLADLLRKEPLSNYFEFGFDEIKEVASPDLKIKCYIMKDVYHTAAGDYEGAVAIANGNDHEVISIYDGPDYVFYPGYVRNIDCFTSTDGKTIYAVEQHDDRIDLFSLDGSKILPMKLAVDYDRLNSIQTQ